MLLTLALALGSTSAQAADCAAPTRPADLQAALLDGEGAVVDLEEEAVGAAIATLDAKLRCLDQVLLPTDVAAIHRLHAYGAFVGAEIRSARAAFGAARAADLAWAIGDRLAPPGTPLRELFNTASLDVNTEAVTVPSGTSLYVDGVKTAERPLDRPAVLQLVSQDGTVRDSQWLTEDQALPDWSAYATAAAAAVTVPTAPERAERSGLPWWIAGGAALVAGAGVYAWAASDHAAYVDLESGMTEAELATLRGQANTKVAVSGGLGVVGIGLAVVALRW